MAAGSLNINIEQGATFAFVMTWTIDGVNVNLTSYTARLQARVDAEDTTTVLSLTSPSGGIVLGGAAGTITLSQSATQTALIAPASYVYDLELVSSGGVVTRLVQGDLLVSAEITR
jgi:hypothetical protein